MIHKEMNTCKAFGQRLSKKLCKWGILKSERKTLTQKKKSNKDGFKKHLPDPEELARELANAESIDDFYGKDGFFA